MEHNAVLIGGAGLVASLAAWLLCRLSGYTVAAWVAPLAITAFCLGLFVGAENTTSGRLRVPSLSHHMHSPHLAHRSVIVELRGALERMQGQFKALLPSARAPKGRNSVMNVTLVLHRGVCPEPVPVFLQSP
jgi:hypothetical protein